MILPDGTDYADIWRAVEARRRELGIVCLEMDRRVGLASGLYSKLTCGLKRPSLAAFSWICEVLGLRIRLEPIPGFRPRQPLERVAKRSEIFRRVKSTKRINPHLPDHWSDAI